jgi:hypothetical protein
LVSETGFLLPSIPSHEKKADDVVPHVEIPLYPIPEFDLKTFNECIPERKAIFDHQNKEIAVRLLCICIPHFSIFQCMVAF